MRVGSPPNGKSAPSSSTPDGDTKVWNQMWSDLGPGERMQFVRGRPRTLRQLWQRAYFDAIWGMMGAAAPDASYCELGAGRGTTSTYLRSHGCDVTMVDLSEQGFRAARENFRDLGIEPARMVIADAADTRLPEASFDCIFSIGVLEHFVDPKPVLSETVRLLKPGGLAWHLVIPKISRLRAAPVHAVLNPPRLMLNLWRHLRSVAGSTARSQSASLRTSFTSHEWTSWSRRGGASDVRCIGYNPFHVSHTTPSLDRTLTVPVYWAAYQRLLRRRAAPRLACPESIALCDLLLFSKT